MNNLIEKLTYYGAINEAGMEDTPTKRCMREAAVELHRLQVELISVLNTLPTQREWVGLTDIEWMNIVNKNAAWFGWESDEVAHQVTKLVEARLKEKNT